MRYFSMVVHGAAAAAAVYIIQVHSSSTSSSASQVIEVREVAGKITKAFGGGEDQSFNINILS